MNRLFFGMLGAAAIALGGCTAPADEAAASESALVSPAESGAPYPIVLIHGMSGFENLHVGPLDVIEYWRGIVEDLGRHGQDVYVTVAPPFATSEVRAQAIAGQIDEILAKTGKAKVNLVGHSQGGLDARVLASPNGLGYGDRIASVTTVSTPHRGSKVADVVLGLVGWIPPEITEAVTDAVLRVLQVTAYDMQANPDILEQTKQLSTAYMRDVFNPKYVDDPRVEYESYAGRANLRTGLLECGGAAYPNEPWKVAVAQPGLFALANFLEDGSLRVNDGLVTVESARWGRFMQCVAADYLGEVGHLPIGALAFDHLGFFRELVARLRHQRL